ncbi:MAG: N-acetylmuramic acid 6-phosphate etherase [Ruthenibacterium lactatiformans]
MVQIKTIGTEQRNPNTLESTADTAEILRLMNEEDKAGPAVEQVLPQVEKAVDVIYAHMRCGGRLIYCGCGTSGRLGVLDASECPPTFGVEPGLVRGVIAGGPDALTNAAEGAEDHFEDGAKDLQALDFRAQDVLVGIAASGRTPYVLGAMDYARVGGTRDRADLLPRLRHRCGRGYRHRPTAGAGGRHRLHPPEKRHRTENGAEYAVHCRDGKAGEGIQQPDGGCVRQQPEAGGARGIHRLLRDRREPGARARRFG